MVSSVPQSAFVDSWFSGNRGVYVHRYSDVLGSISLQVLGGSH